MKAFLRLGLAALVLALTAGAASAATPLRIVEAGGTTYPEKSYILTLPAPRSLVASDVRVTENGARPGGVAVVRQGSEQSKSAVVLAIDESLTMRGEPIANALAAARAFAARANAQEQVGIVAFNGKVNVIQPLTSNPKDITDALSQKPQLAYGTKNYDALLQSLNLITAAKVSAGSIIFLTDGQNVGSVAQPADVLKALKKAHVRVFSVGLVSPVFNPAQLEQMASTTGGTYVEATGPAKLRPILLQFGRRLSSEYLLTYNSHANPGSKVAVNVTVRGIPGAASTEYTAPKLHLTPAPAYHPSSVDSLVQSRYTMAIIALIFAGLIFFAVSFAARSKVDPLVDRVGDFVAIQRQERPERAAKKQTVMRRPGFLTREKDDTTPGRMDRLGESLELAGISMPPGRLVALTVFGTLLVILVLMAIVGPIGIVFGLLTPFIVRTLITSRISRKRKAFAEQLPDNLDVLASALRAGHSLVGALTVVADDAAEPARGEFRRVLAEEQFGVQLEDAFKVVVERMDNDDLDQVALVARLQREMGSNSAEVLDRVIDTVRARTEMRRLISTLTAQGRLSRWVLTLLPVAVALLLTLVNPGYMKPLYDSFAGKFLLVLAAGMVVAGSWVIGKIIDIKV